MMKTWSDTFLSNVSSLDDRRKQPYVSSNELFAINKSSVSLEDFRGETWSHLGQSTDALPKELSMRDMEIEDSSSNSLPVLLKKSSVQKEMQEIVQDSSPIKQVRMQEIEDRLLETGVFRVIDGYLCIWTGMYYRRLNLSLFNMVARTHLTEDQEDKISAFKRFEDAYKFMLANEELKDMFTEESFEAAKKMIVFKNGVYHGDTGEFTRHSPKNPVLFIIDAEYLNLPENKLDTSVLDNIVLNATNGDYDSLETLYQTIGYISSQGSDAKKIFIMGTEPDSGKSITGEFIGKLLGPDNIFVLPIQDLSERFALGNIGMKVLNYNMDLPNVEIDAKAVQKLKQLTGDPRIESEEKYVQGRTVVHHCKFLYGTNYPVRLKQSDNAFYRRLVVIPFLNGVEDVDKDYNLPQKLWEARNAIATKAAHAYTQLYRKNYVFTQSATAKAMISTWSCQGNGNLVQQFWKEKCVENPSDPDCFVATDDLFRSYCAYCKETGQALKSETKRSFSKEFAKYCKLEKTKRRVNGFQNPVNGYVGLSILT